MSQFDYSKDLCLRSERFTKFLCFLHDNNFSRNVEVEALLESVHLCMRARDLQLLPMPSSNVSVNVDISDYTIFRLDFAENIARGLMVDSEPRHFVFSFDRPSATERYLDSTFVTFFKSSDTLEYVNLLNHALVNSVLSK